MLSLIFAQQTDKPARLVDIQKVFTNIVGLLLPFGALVLFVMLLVGGIQYITSGPSPQKVEKAKATLTYAIAGVVLLAMSYLILVIIEQVTGAEITNFRFTIFGGVAPSCTGGVC